MFFLSLLSNMLLLSYLCVKIHYREYCITEMKGLPGHLSTYLRYVTRFAALEPDRLFTRLYQHCIISNGVMVCITRYQRLDDQRSQSRCDFIWVHRNSNLHRLHILYHKNLPSFICICPSKPE